MYSLKSIGCSTVSSSVHTFMCSFVFFSVHFSFCLHWQIRLLIYWLFFHGLYSFVHAAVHLLTWLLSDPSNQPSIYQLLADLLFITTSHIQLWPLYEATANHRGQKSEINQTLLPHWPFSYWAAVKLSFYTLWMAPDGNCLEMADKFTCWAEVQTPLASSSAVSEKIKEKHLDERMSSRSNSRKTFNDPSLIHPSLIKHRFLPLVFWGNAAFDSTIWLQLSVSEWGSFKFTPHKFVCVLDGNRTSAHFYPDEFQNI